MNDFDDERLARAVSEATHWSDLFSRLGFEGRPGSDTQRRVKSRISDAALSTAHFRARSGPRRQWTVEDLRQAISSSSSWREVARKIGASHITTQREADDLGIDTSHLNAVNHMSEPRVEPFETEASLDALRHAAEQYAVGWYTLHGYQVYRPVVDHGVDLLVKGPDGSYSQVQVKTTSRTNNAVSLTRSVGPDRTERRLYPHAVVDEFFVMCAAGECYRLPFAAVSGRTGVVLGSKYAKYRVDLFPVASAPVS